MLKKYIKYIKAWYDNIYKAWYDKKKQFYSNTMCKNMDCHGKYQKRHCITTIMWKKNQKKTWCYHYECTKKKKW